MTSEQLRTQQCAGLVYLNHPSRARDILRALFQTTGRPSNFPVTLEISFWSVVDTSGNASSKETRSLTGLPTPSDVNVLTFSNDWQILPLSSSWPNQPSESMLDLDFDLRGVWICSIAFLEWSCSSFNSDEETGAFMDLICEQVRFHSANNTLVKRMHSTRSDSNTLVSSRGGPGDLANAEASTANWMDSSPPWLAPRSSWALLHKERWR